MCDVPHWYDPELIDMELRKKNLRIIRLESKLRDIANIASSAESVFEKTSFSREQIRLMNLQDAAMRASRANTGGVFGLGGLMGLFGGK